MAEDKKQTQEAKPQTVSENTAFETSGPRAGRLKPGFQFKYENYRDKAGNLRSRRVVTKVGK